MANTRIVTERAPFGTIAMGDVKLPKVTGTRDDVTIAKAIGRIGGGVQYLLASTSFAMGRFARSEKRTDYAFDNAYEGYYETFYGSGAGLSVDSKKQQRLSITVYAEVAMLPWEARDVALWAFDLPSPITMPQKAALLRKVIKTYPKAAPTREQLLALMPGGGNSTVPTIKGKFSGMLKALKDVETDKAFKKMWADINGDKVALERYRAAVTAMTMLADRAKDIVDGKPKKPRKAKAKAAPNKAEIAAAAKALAAAVPAKGDTIN